MENIALRCVRCDTLMEEGQVKSADTPFPFFWTSLPPGRKGPYFVLGWGKWAKPYREANARIKASRMPVKHYRCPQCGYIEWNARRDSS